MDALALTTDKEEEDLPTVSTVSSGGSSSPSSTESSATAAIDWANAEVVIGGSVLRPGVEIAQEWKRIDDYYGDKPKGERPRKYLSDHDVSDIEDILKKTISTAAFEKKGLGKAKHARLEFALAATQQEELKRDLVENLKDVKKTIKNKMPHDIVGSEHFVSLRDELLSSTLCHKPSKKCKNQRFVAIVRPRHLRRALTKLQTYGGFENKEDLLSAACQIWWMNQSFVKDHVGFFGDDPIRPLVDRNSNAKQAAQQEQKLVTVHAQDGQGAGLMACGPVVVPDLKGVEFPEGVVFSFAPTTIHHYYHNSGPDDNKLLDGKNDAAVVVLGGLANTKQDVAAAQIDSDLGSKFAAAASPSAATKKERETAASPLAKTDDQDSTASPILSATHLRDGSPKSNEDGCSANKKKKTTALFGSPDLSMASAKADGLYSPLQQGTDQFGNRFKKLQNRPSSKAKAPPSLVQSIRNQAEHNKSETTAASVEESKAPTANVKEVTICTDPLTQLRLETGAHDLSAEKAKAFLVLSGGDVKQAANLYAQLRPNQTSLEVDTRNAETSSVGGAPAKLTAPERNKPQITTTAPFYATAPIKSAPGKSSLKAPPPPSSHFKLKEAGKDPSKEDQASETAAKAQEEAARESTRVNATTNAVKQSQRAVKKASSVKDAPPAIAKDTAVAAPNPAAVPASEAPTTTAKNETEVAPAGLKPAPKADKAVKTKPPSGGEDDSAVAVNKTKGDKEVPSAAASPKAGEGNEEYPLTASQEDEANPAAGKGKVPAALKGSETPASGFKKPPAVPSDNRRTAKKKKNHDRLSAEQATAAAALLALSGYTKVDEATAGGLKKNPSVPSASIGKAAPAFHKDEIVQITKGKNKNKLAKICGIPQNQENGIWYVVLVDGTLKEIGDQFGKKKASLQRTQAPKQAAAAPPRFAIAAEDDANPPPAGSGPCGRLAGQAR